MDYDKILCLDAGKVVRLATLSLASIGFAKRLTTSLALFLQIEFDTPAKLIKAGGQFADMVANSPDADELRELAAGQH
jgi:hypothetical protein